jgi:hypothetical protein
MNAKDNGDYTPHHKEVWENGGMATRYLNISNRWRCGQFHAPIALSPRDETRYPLDRRLGGVQS